MWNEALVKLGLVTRDNEMTVAGMMLLRLYE